MFVIESREREATTTIRVVLPNSLHARLSEAAEKAKVDIQEAIRQAIAYALEQSEGGSSNVAGRKRRSNSKGGRPSSYIHVHHSDQSCEKVPVRSSGAADTN